MPRTKNDHDNYPTPPGGWKLWRWILWTRDRYKAGDLRVIAGRWERVAPNLYGYMPSSDRAAIRRKPTGDWRKRITV